MWLLTNTGVQWAPGGFKFLGAICGELQAKQENLLRKEAVEGSKERIQWFRLLNVQRVLSHLHNMDIFVHALLHVVLHISLFVLCLISILTIDGCIF